MIFLPRICSNIIIASTKARRAYQREAFWKSLHDHRIVIRGALQDAVKKNIIPYNPTDRVTLPRKRKYVGSFYTQEQAKALLEAIKGTIIENIVTLTIVYGLRRSEAVGMKWSAINFENDTFTTESTVVRFSEIVEKATTKNQASHRTYPMTPEIKQMLLSIREQQQEMKKSLAILMLTVDMCLLGRTARF